MSNPTSPAASASTGSESSSPCKKRRKQWPPASEEIFLVDDYDIPSEVDVDLRKIEFLSVDDPVFFIHYASDIEIHAALALAGSPVPQGATAAASAIAFRQFVRTFFIQISPNCRVPQQAPAAGFSECALQRRSNQEAGNVLNMSIPWAAWMVTVSATAGARTGTAYEMTPSPGGAAGGGRSPQCQHIRRPLFIVP